MKPVRWVMTRAVLNETQQHALESSGVHRALRQTCSLRFTRVHVCHCVPVLQVKHFVSVYQQGSGSILKCRKATWGTIVLRQTLGPWYQRVSVGDKMIRLLRRAVPGPVSEPRRNQALSSMHLVPSTWPLLSPRTSALTSFCHFKCHLSTN